MSFVNDIGAQLKAARRSCGMTQDQLAEKLHVTRQTISSWENGRTQPGYEVLQALSEAVGVPLHVLLNEAPPEPVVETIVETVTVTEEVEVPRAIPWRRIIAAALALMVLGCVCYVVWRISPKVDAPGLEWFQQPNAELDDQPYLVMEPTESPVKAYAFPAGSPARWMFRVFLLETHGVQAKIQRVQSVYFSREWFGRVVPSASVAMKNWQLTQHLGSNIIKPNGVVTLPFNPESFLPYCGMGLMVEIIDDQGREQTFRMYIPFAQPQKE